MFTPNDEFLELLDQAEKNTLSETIPIAAVNNTNAEELLNSKTGEVEDFRNKLMSVENVISIVQELDTTRLVSREEAVSLESLGRNITGGRPLALEDYEFSGYTEQHSSVGLDDLVTKTKEGLTKEADILKKTGIELTESLLIALNSLAKQRAEVLAATFSSFNVTLVNRLKDNDISSLFSGDMSRLQEKLIEIDRSSDWEKDLCFCTNAREINSFLHHNQGELKECFYDIKAIKVEIQESTCVEKLIDLSARLKEIYTIAVMTNRQFNMFISKTKAIESHLS